MVVVVVVVCVSVCMCALSLSLSGVCECVCVCVCVRSLSLSLSLCLCLCLCLSLVGGIVLFLTINFQCILPPLTKLWCSCNVCAQSLSRVHVKNPECYSDIPTTVL